MKNLIHPSLLLSIILFYSCNPKKTAEPKPDDITTKPPLIKVYPVVAYGNKSIAPIVYIGDTAKFQIDINSVVNLSRMEVFKFNNLEGTKDSILIYNKSLKDLKVISEQFSVLVVDNKSYLFKLKVTAIDEKSMLYSIKPRGDSVFFGYTVTEFLDTITPFKIYNSGIFWYGGYANEEKILYGSILSSTPKDVMPKDFVYSPYAAYAGPGKYMSGRSEVNQFSHFTNQTSRTLGKNFNNSPPLSENTYFLPGWYTYNKGRRTNRKDLVNFVKASELNYNTATPYEIEDKYLKNKNNGTDSIASPSIGDVYVGYLYDDGPVGFRHDVYAILRIKNIVDDGKSISSFPFGDYTELEMRIVNNNRFKNNR